jgi:Bacterial extracellular solute-binding protein
VASVFAFAPLLALLAGPHPVAGSPRGDAPLLVRATAAAAPCVRAAAEAYAGSIGRPIAVETGALQPAGSADVVVGADAEMTHALEAGEALDESEAEIARIPWVLSVSRDSALKVERLTDLETSEVEVAVLAGEEAHEARRALGSLPAERVRATADTAALKTAALALVPLSLAGPGARVKTDLRPLTVSAAATARSARRTEARAFVQFLASEPGKRAFAACGAPPD